MAQLVEQRIRNAWVTGSSPVIGSFFCGISTSVVRGLPKPERRVRFPYSALLFHTYLYISPFSYIQLILDALSRFFRQQLSMQRGLDGFFACRFIFSA